MPSVCSAAGIPSASHAQFANQERPPASTLCGVFTAENGFSIRIAAPSGSSTSAWASWRRRQAATTTSAASPSVAASSVGAGALPIRTKDE